MKTEKITINPASEDILDDLTSVFPKRDFQTFARYLQQSERNECVFLVALNDDKPVGYCLLYWQSDFSGFSQDNMPEIVDLIVAESYHRKGIGQKILQEIEKCGIKNGSKKIGLIVLKSNTNAHALYQKAGYLEISRSDVPNLNDTNLMLVKDLVT